MYGSHTNNQKKERRYFRDTNQKVRWFNTSISAPNLTTILSGVSDPLFVIQKVGHPFTFQARNQTEFTTANFDTVWDLLLSNPDQPFGKL